MSSIAPSIAISAAPAMIPQKPWSLPSAAAGMAIAARWRSPPSSGVGHGAWRRRSSVDVSTIPARHAAWETTGVSSTASKNATRNPTAAACWSSSDQSIGAAYFAAEVADSAHDASFAMRLRMAS